MYRILRRWDCPDPDGPMGEWGTVGSARDLEHLRAEIPETLWRPGHYKIQTAAGEHICSVLLEDGDLAASAVSCTFWPG